MLIAIGNKPHPKFTNGIFKFDFDFFRGNENNFNALVDLHKQRTRLFNVVFTEAIKNHKNQTPEQPVKQSKQPPLSPFPFSMLYDFISNDLWNEIDSNMCRKFVTYFWYISITFQTY